MDQRQGDIYLPQVFVYLVKFQQILYREDQDVLKNRVCQDLTLFNERNNILPDNFF
jgi:hypothetical protein